MTRWGAARSGSAVHRFIYCRDGEVSYYPTMHFWDGYCEDAWLYECPEALTFDCPSGECQEGWVDIDPRKVPAEIAAGAPRFCAP